MISPVRTRVDFYFNFVFFYYWFYQVSLLLFLRSSRATSVYALSAGWATACFGFEDLNFVFLCFAFLRGVVLFRFSRDFVFLVEVVTFCFCDLCFDKGCCSSERLLWF